MLTRNIYKNKLEIDKQAFNSRQWVYSIVSNYNPLIFRRFLKFLLSYSMEYIVKNVQDNQYCSKCNKIVRGQFSKNLQEKRQTSRHCLY